MSLVDIGETCIDCGCSVAANSGHYVNRIPANNATQTGYLCSSCQLVECDRCGQLAFEPTTVETDDEVLHVCEECVTEVERAMYDF